MAFLSKRNKFEKDHMIPAITKTIFYPKKK